MILPSPHRQPVLEIDGLTAVHGQGRRIRQVLSPTTLSIMPGESVAVVGRSGAGKSTLADIVLGLHAPSSGSVRVLGEDWCARELRPQSRRRHLVQGVPQDPAAAFVPRWTLRQSITQAVRRLDGPDNGPDGGSLHGSGGHHESERGIESRIRAAVDMASLDPALLDRRPAEISGGQAQRAALARALAVNPAVIVADEPTSALDPDTAESVSASLLSLVAEAGVALLLVTHDPVFAARCTTTVTLTAPKESP